MDVTVIAAAGRTGAHVVTQALARGHRVRALARHPEKLRSPETSLSVAAVDVLDTEQLCDAVAGADALISTLGVGASRAATDLYSRGAVSALAAMAASRIEKLAVISAAPAGPRDEQPLLQRRVAMPLLERIFGATYHDMRQMEEILRGSAADWISLRPPRLLDKPAIGTYRLSPEPLRARTITYPDLATALLDVIESDAQHRAALYVAN